MNVNKVFAIFLIVMISIVVGLIFLLKIPEKLHIIKPKPSATPEERVTTLTTQAQTIKEKLTKTDKKVGDLLLEENDKFRVNYLISNDQFSVIIKEEPFVENKNTAEQWFLSQGFKHSDLCLFRINFVPTKEVEYQLSAADTVPTGCNVPAIDGLAPSPIK